MEKLFYIAGVSLFSGIAAKISQLLTAKKQSVTVNEVLLYGASEENRRKDLGLNNLFCIYYVLSHANYTIDVCVPSLNSDTISKCLIKTHQIKIKVRIVVHKNPVSNIKVFQDCGIEVKVIRNSEVLLEHEFMLVDAVGDCEEALAIIGSLDYEVKSVNCNSDSTILTSEINIVSTLKREFDRIWNSSIDAK